MGCAIRCGWVLAVLCLLGACGGAEPRRQPLPDGVMAVSARLAAPPAQAVEVAIGNLAPGRRIELVALIDPQGARYPAQALVAVTTSEGSLVSGPRVGVGIAGGSSSGIHPSLNLGWNITAAEPERTGRRIEARVPIPDPAAYRASATHWRVEVEVTEIDGTRRTLSFPAGGN